MASRRIMRWLVLGAAVAALSACDDIQGRMDQFGKLTSDVLKQIGGGGSDAPAFDLLAAAPVENRALFGVMQAPVDPPVMSLDEMLQTQSFFAVGSVIAMPK